MDISDMISGGKGITPVDLDAEPDEDNAIKDEASAARDTETGADEESDSPDDTELTAVQRIQAYREGKIAPPAVGKGDNADQDAEATQESGDNSVDDAEYLGNDHEHHPDDRDVAADLLADDHEKSGRNLLAGFPGGNIGRRIPKKGLMIGVPIVVALIVAGAVIRALGGDQSDKKPAATTPVASAPAVQTSAAAPANADVIIKPESVDGPEYPISVESPMDAFSGQPGKGWVCSGLDGTVLKITLPEPMRVREVDVLPGLLGTDKDGAELWAKNRIVTSASFTLDYGDPVMASYDKNKRELQPTIFRDPTNPDRGPITKTITMTILYTEDVSGKGAGAAGPSTEPKGTGVLGDLGGLGGDDQTSSTPAASDGGSRPATFAIGAIQIMGYSPS